MNTELSKRTIFLIWLLVHVSVISWFTFDSKILVLQLSTLCFIILILMDNFMTTKEKPRVVVCAAIRCVYSKQLYGVGPRHFGPGFHMSGDGQHMEQGFIDQFGVFMTREEAYVVAKAAGQIKYRCGGDDGRLFSENLY